MIRKVYPQLLGIIGGGNIAQAILDGINNNKYFKPESIMISEPNIKTRKMLAVKYGTIAIYDNNQILNSCQNILLAIKPVKFKEIGKELIIPSTNNSNKQNIISLMAGINHLELNTIFGDSNIFRCMPNTSAKINKSVTIWHTDCKDETALHIVSDFFSNLGFHQKVDDELLIEKATAICGSGPAYIYDLMENMIDASVLIGLERELATKMVVNTFEGTSLMAKKNESNIHNLKKNIVSPGGTTAQALYQLEKHGFKNSINEAVLAAYKHAIGK